MTVDMKTDMKVDIEADKNDNMVHAYVDGACKGNPGAGGWGVYISNLSDSLMSKYHDVWEQRYAEINLEVNRQEAYVKISGASDALTTNNQMELQAAIECCKFFQEYFSEQEMEKVIIYTDSTYVFKGITIWIYNWRKLNRLTTLSSNPVKNINLWLELDSLNRKTFIWKWVRGHSGNCGNDIADQLATNAIE